MKKHKWCIEVETNIELNAESRVEIDRLLTVYGDKINEVISEQGKEKGESK